MEKMQLQYHREAEKNGCYILSACGFDSVPADFGVIHLTRNFSGNYFLKFYILTTNT